MKKYYCSHPDHKIIPLEIDRETETEVHLNPCPDCIAEFISKVIPISLKKQSIMIDMAIHPVKQLCEELKASQADIKKRLNTLKKS